MNWLIVVAGGQGNRMKLGRNKIFAKIGKLPVICWTLKAFEKSRFIDNIVISAASEDITKIKAIIKKYKFKKVLEIVGAKNSRQESTLAVLETFKAKMKGGDLVGVHNAVNPFIKQEEIAEVFRAAKLFKTALLAQAARDTVKITNEKGLVYETPMRQYSWYAQTPQVANFENLYKAHRQAHEDKFVGTDDAQLLERIGVKPKIVPCSNRNFKITFPEDLILASEVLKTWTE